MQPINERMPVIMPPDHYSHWLDKTVDENEAFELLDNQAYKEMGLCRKVYRSGHRYLHNLNT